MPKSQILHATRRISGSFLAVCLVLAYGHPTAAKAEGAVPESPPVRAQSAVVLDATDNSWVTRYHAEDKLYPASLTKLLTAVLLVEHSKPTDVFTASANAAAQEPSNISLHPGEKLTAKDCLYAMMLHSANDVAVMVAENIAGSQAKFADLMNEKAKEIGMVHSHFVTPNGLHDEHHYSTAADLALLMQAAMQHQEIAQALKTKTYTLHRPYAPTQLINQNRMLKDDSILGGKSGFTDQAGSCLVEAANRNGHQLIAVNLKDPTLESMYDDNEALLSYAAKQFELVSLPAAHSIEDWASPATGIQYTFRLTSDYRSTAYYRQQDITTDFTRTNSSNWLLPGEQVGVLHLLNMGKEIAALPVVASISHVNQKPSPVPSAAAIGGLTALLLFYHRVKLALRKQSPQRLPVAKPGNPRLQALPQEDFRTQNLPN